MGANNLADFRSCMTIFCACIRPLWKFVRKSDQAAQSSTAICPDGGMWVGPTVRVDIRDMCSTG